LLYCATEAAGVYQPLVLFHNILVVQNHNILVIQYAQSGRFAKGADKYINISRKEALIGQEEKH